MARLVASIAAFEPTGLRQPYIHGLLLAHRGKLVVEEYQWVRESAAPHASLNEKDERGRVEIDGTGRHLIPGLIDSHVHLDQVAGMTAEHEAAHPEVAAATRAQTPRSYLYFGFTTVVDLFGCPDFIVQWNARDVRPDAYFCGGAPIVNGYPMALLPEGVRFDAHNDFAYFLYDDRQAGRIPAAIDPTAHAPEGVVARMAEDGAICAKTHYETGFGGLSGPS